MAAPVVTSTWQACLYARLRCEGAVPDDLPPPAEEPSLLAASWHSGRAAALAARRMPVLLLAVLALLAGSYWLVLNFYIRQHLDMGRTGSWLEDFGWRGTAWLVCVLAQQYVAAAYGAAAVMAAAQRAVLRGQPGGLAALLPSRGVLKMTLLLLPIVCGPILAGAAAVALGVLRALLGPVSFFLTEVLLAPVAALCVVALLRLLLITVPLALGRRFAAAESWRLSRGHVWLVVAGYATTLLPLAALLAVLADWLPAGPAMENFVRVPLGIVLNALLAGGAAAVLYRRLQTGPAEEERPSRNPFRRREPALSDLHLADLTAGGYKHD
jgi:hypothetical protein